jgi:acyl carrier protein
MQDFKTLDRAEIVDMVLVGVRDVLEQADRPIPDELGETTHLIGKRSILDSLGMVTLIVDLEQRIEEEYDMALTLADDRAMSQQHSPFLTVQSLTNYICMLIAEERQDG